MHGVPVVRLCLVPVLALATSAGAAEALTFDAVRVATHGQGAPSITFHPGVAGRLRAVATCGDRRWTTDVPITPGADRGLTLDGLSEGVHACTVDVTLVAADGSEGELSFPLEVASLPMLTLKATLDDLDLANGRLVVHAPREIQDARLAAYGAGGALVAEVGADLSRPADPGFTWGPGLDDVVKLEVEARDAWGFRAQLTLSPWHYAIPHEDVVFPTGSAVIPPEEVAKLETSWAEVARTLERYGSVVEIQLYVAGYTDTVGEAVANQALSERRARAIGAWFRARGFPGKVHFQGFGEQAQAVRTADEVDEPRNRRALYVLAASVPPVSEHLPRPAWKAL